MNRLKLFISGCLLLLAFALKLHAQSPSAKKLETEVYNLNNAANYDSSMTLIQGFLQKPGMSEEDSYYGNLYLSFTYKRLFDYASNLRFLDSALVHGMRTEKKEFFSSNIRCRKALALFDIHRYGEADTMMQQLASENYKNLNDEYQSKIMMQEAYLLFREKRNPEAEKRYDRALEKMKSSSPCDLPMIYGKKIELYAAMQAPEKMNLCYQLSLACADSCGIEKYKMYSVEMMHKAYATMGDFAHAYPYFKEFDSLQNAYNQKEHLDKLSLLETKYETGKKEQTLALQGESLNAKNNLIAALLLSLLAMVLAGLLYFTWQRRRKLVRERAAALHFTRMLLDETEAEKKRIAADLHDSISHELLLLKGRIPPENLAEREQIDDIIQNVRHISRDLLPPMFDKVGLQLSIEQIAERVQQQDEFMLSTEINYKKSLNAETELHVFRMIQEAVNNILKYSGAMAGKITLVEKENVIYVEVKDNGKGFDVARALASPKSFGLHNIIGRSEVIGGKANIISGKQGTIITLEIPISEI